MAARCGARFKRVFWLSIFCGRYLEGAGVRTEGVSYPCFLPKATAVTEAGNLKAALWGVCGGCLPSLWGGTRQKSWGGTVLQDGGQLSKSCSLCLLLTASSGVLAWGFNSRAFTQGVSIR